MIQEQLQRGQMMNQQMQQQQAGIVQQNMQNPQVQAMHQDYIHRGGTMNFQQFAYNYAATGGFSAEGMARYNQSEQNIQQNERSAYDAYRQNQQQNSQVVQQRFDRESEIAHQRGNLLSGTTDYSDP